MSELVNASPLGKVSEYQSEYNPKLLFSIPRKEKQQELGLDPENLPFVGSDVWFAYELSWLNTKGKPLAMVGRFELPCNSANLIESKSFKLYLNSFNQSQFDSVEVVEALMIKDLSAAAEAVVGVRLMTIAEMEDFGFHHVEGVEVDQFDISIDCYDYSPDLLKKVEGQKEEVLISHLLKSNCPVTGQPDWGTVVVEYKGQAIDHESFLRFICSFRGHQEFHEQCVERVFTEIQARFQMEELTVYAHYVRRGGLDINPWRSTNQPEQKNIRLIRQ